MHLQWNIWTIRKEGEIMGDAIISVEELSKSFGQHEVLRKIDFNVEPGEIICIVGSSGSGKSTLLRCINKLETQTSGKIRYHGKEIGAVQKEINDYRSKVGMVFQSFNLFNNMTVLQNCMLCTRKVLHLSKEEAFDRAITHLKQVGMAPFINANPTQLSGGQKQRVAIARTTGLTMIIVTHEMAFARDVSTRTIFMDQGYIVEDAPPAELFKNPKNARTREFLSRYLAG